MHLVDRGNRIDVGSPDDVAQLQKNLTNVTRDGRADGGVLDLHAGVFHLRLAGLHGGRRRISIGTELRVVVGRDEFLVEQLFLANFLGSGTIGHSTVARQRGLGQMQGGYIRTRIDANQHRALLDLLALLEIDLNDLTVNTALDLHEGIGFSQADALDAHRHVLLLDRGKCDDFRAAARTTTAPPSATCCSPCRTLLGRARFPRGCTAQQIFVVIASAGESRQKDHEHQSFRTQNPHRSTFF